MAEQTPVTIHRAERVLAYMVASSVGLSLICFFAILFASFGKVDVSQGLWPVVIVLPGVGLPLGLLGLIVLLIVSGVRRGRESKDARN